MKLETFAPIAIGVEDNKNHYKIETSLIKYCLSNKKSFGKGGKNWTSKVYNTCGIKNLHDIEEFNILNKWIFNEVCIYAGEIGYYKKPITCNQSWFNIYKKYDYQEYHTHGNFDISAVYFLKSNKNSSKLIIKSHEPVCTTPIFIESNPYTWRRLNIDPVPGRLIIFKSNVEHCVEQHKSKDTRISLAYNFKIR